jgi:cytoskeletal protein CcmA (bactofilin family)
MTRYLAALLFAFSAVALGSAVDIGKVNSKIDVEAGREAGDVETVNGSIRIGSDARVRGVETVNGSIRLEPRAAANSVETVNGAVTLAEDVLVSGDAGTVNGSVTLMRGARVEGRLENVNGTLRLEGATVRGGIETVNGDVFVGAGSRVDGGILVEKSSGGSWRKSDRLPRITIESGAEVSGALRFEREVELYVGAGALVGPVEGVAPRRHDLP